MPKQSRPLETLPVAVLGAGPVGLAAAAHLLERGLEPLVLEAGSRVATHLRDVAHVRLFSPWRLNVDQAARRLLEADGWTGRDPEALPTAGALVADYLEPLAAHPALAPRIQLDQRVLGVSRAGHDKVRSGARATAPFRIRTRSADGATVHWLAGAVIDATGTWGTPNPLGADGLPADGEPEAAEHIDYGMPDVLVARRRAYAGAATLVVGAGHSAAGTLLALEELAREEPETRIHWALRGAVPTRLSGTAGGDGLPARGRLNERVAALVADGRVTLHDHFPVAAVRPDGDRLRVDPVAGADRPPLHGIDRIIAATGARPDWSPVRELRIATDPVLECAAPLAEAIDPSVHHCGSVPAHGHRELAQPEPRFYVAGVKSYGRAPAFLMSTGYGQVASIAAALAGDREAADRAGAAEPDAEPCCPALSEDGCG